MNQVEYQEARTSSNRLCVGVAPQRGVCHDDIYAFVFVVSFLKVSVNVNLFHN